MADVRRLAGLAGPGKRILVAGAPTRQGPVAYTLRATRDGAVLAWKADVKAGTRLRWPVPYMARDVRARGLNRRTGVITLPGRSGRLAVSWSLVGDDPTFEKTFAQLMTRYFNSPGGAVETARDKPTVPSDPEG